ARAFYAAVLGPSPLEIVPVPAPAAARGAPSHWLGAIGVDDVTETHRALIARGATALGPITRHDHGSFASLPDAGGALLALCTPPRSAPQPALRWCHLDAHDAARTFAGYSALFGWRAGATHDLGSHGQLTQFAWHEGGEVAGSYRDLAQ